MRFLMNLFADRRSACNSGPYCRVLTHTAAYFAVLHNQSQPRSAKASMNRREFIRQTPKMLRELRPATCPQPVEDGVIGRPACG
jgi:hypothetical protein